MKLQLKNQWQTAFNITLIVFVMRWGNVVMRFFQAREFSRVAEVLAVVNNTFIFRSQQYIFSYLLLPRKKIK